MRRFVLLACAVGVALVSLAGAEVAAQAQEDASLEEAPPKAVLMKGNKVLQKGRVGTYCNITGCADSFNIFPDPRTVALVKAGTPLRIRIMTPEEPAGDSLVSYRRLTEHGLIKGKARVHADPPLEPVVQDGRTVAWDASFTVRRPDRHYYMYFDAGWVLESGRGQLYEWGFHVKTRAGT